MKNCDLDFKLEEVLPKFSKEFQKKIMHSVELIRKAEPLALAYDPEDGFFNTFSGGKDSQCLYHIVKMAGVKFKTHMNLTSVDPPEVIRFVKTEYPDVVLAKPKDSIYNLAIKKDILPTMRVRWCCAEYKEMAGAGKVTLIGIRHSESIRRAKRNEVEVSNHGYSGDLKGLAEYRKQRNSGRKPRKGTFSIINVNGESEVGCIHGKESLLISPIIEWTEEDVWTFLNTLGIKHCCLYDEGFSRIGCILCPMSQRKQKEVEMKRWPHVKRGWIRAIKAIRRGGYLQKDISGGTSQITSFRSHEQVGDSDWRPTGEMSAKGFIPKQMLRTNKLFDPTKISGGGKSQICNTKAVDGQSSELDSQIGGGIKGSPSPLYIIHKDWLQHDGDWISTKQATGSEAGFRIASRLTA